METKDLRAISIVTRATAVCDCPKHLVMHMSDEPFCSNRSVYSLSCAHTRTANNHDNHDICISKC